jgi:acid phosphatase (class A)
MHSISVRTVLLCLLLCTPLCAQQHESPTAKPKAPRTSTFLQSSPLNLSLIIQRPPKNNSATTIAELKQLHDIENVRTVQEVNEAKADDAEQDIFVYRSIFGSSFAPGNLPILAAFSADVHNEEGIAAESLKANCARPRPYQLDHSLHPICKVTTEANSYPSGHTLSGYLLGYTLAYLVPEKKDLILARTDEYAHNRLVCGVHYPSDVEASKTLASAMFGAMLLNPSFQQRLREAQKELQIRLIPVPSR